MARDLFARFAEVLIQEQGLENSFVVDFGDEHFVKAVADALRARGSIVQVDTARRRIIVSGCTHPVGAPLFLGEQRETASAR